MPRSDGMPYGRTIAIGDIHGCDVALESLVAALGLSGRDRLIMLGDAVDRGPGSRRVVEQLLSLREQCRLVPILGNHEQMLLDAVDGRIALPDWLIHGGAETLDSYGKGSALTAIPEEHIEFIRTWGDYYETETHFFAHGNYQHHVPLAQQPWEVMRWRSLSYYTPDPHVSGKIAVLGHTSNKQGQVVNLGHLVCIDTYCHGGGWLTAFDADRGRLWQVSKSGEVRESELPNAR